MDAVIRKEVCRLVADLHKEMGHAVVRLSDAVVPLGGELVDLSVNTKDLFVTVRALRPKNVSRYLHLHRNDPRLDRPGAVLWAAPTQDGEGTILSLGEVTHG